MMRGDLSEDKSHTPVLKQSLLGCVMAAYLQ
jgi:hypothetical protein